MSRKPLNIGVTGPDKGGLAAWWFTKFMLVIHGARAVRIRPKKGIPDLDLHGLIIGGGADINPQHYTEAGIEEIISQSRKEPVNRPFLARLATFLFYPLIFFIRKLFSTKSSGFDIDKERDELEFNLLKKVQKKGIPVLGICRGAQLINVHFGGTLFSDISNFYTEVPRVTSVLPRKKVIVEDKSRLQDILADRVVWVNALHNQAVDRLGDDLKVVARENNGVVQAIEHKKSHFILGVQWHPEYMPQIQSQRSIFKALIEEAQRFSNGT